MPNPRSKHGTLTANVVTTVVLDNHAGEVEILNHGLQSEPIYVTFDGTVPTVAGDNTYAILTERRFRRLTTPATDPLTVKLISGDAPGYSVQGGID